MQPERLVLPGRRMRQPAGIVLMIRRRTRVGLFVEVPIGSARVLERCNGSAHRTPEMIIPESEAEDLRVALQEDS